jgi:hypothetical protein
VKYILIGKAKNNFVLIFRKNSWIAAENALKKETGKTLNKK